MWKVDMDTKRLRESIIHMCLPRTLVDTDSPAINMRR